MSDAIIQVENLTKYYGSKLVLQDINLTIRKGAVYGLLGRNGCGKSTLIKILLGYVAPTFGKAYIFGCDSSELKPELREKIGYMVEGHLFYNYMKINDIYKFTKPYYKNWSDEMFFKMLNYFEFDKKQRIKNLSKGQKAQLNLALTLSYSPELLIMDDPMLGLDTAVRIEFLESIIDIIQSEGRTILFTSHILNEVERICERVGLIMEHQIIIDSDINNLNNKVKTVRLEFNKMPENLNAVPGILSVKKDKNECLISIANYDETKLNQLTAALKPSAVEVIDLTLEQIFMEYTVKRKKFETLSFSNYSAV